VCFNGKTDLDSVLPPILTLLFLCLLAAVAIWLNRRFRLTITPPMPPPETEQEEQWARELDTLKIPERHPIC
jgi:hypothetical protein